MQNYITPAVALKELVIVMESMKDPKPLLSAAPTVTGLNVIVNGF